MFSFTLLEDQSVHCENGQALSIRGHFCDKCHECPISTQHSFIAMSSNCNKMSNNFCPISSHASKICMDKLSVNITDYCLRSNVGDNYWKCPKARKGLNFEQCYDM